MEVSWNCGQDIYGNVGGPHRDIITERPAYERSLPINGLLIDMKLAEHESEGEVRSHFLTLHDKSSQTIHYYQSKI